MKHDQRVWHLLACPRTIVLGEGDDAVIARGVFEVLVGPRYGPPVPGDYVGPRGEELRHVASWSWEPSDAERNEAISATFEIAQGRRPFLSHEWSTEDPHEAEDAARAARHRRDRP